MAEGQHICVVLCQIDPSVSIDRLVAPLLKQNRAHILIFSTVLSTLGITEDDKLKRKFVTSNCSQMLRLLPNLIVLFYIQIVIFFEEIISANHYSGDSSPNGLTMLIHLAVVGSISYTHFKF